MTLNDWKSALEGVGIECRFNMFGRLIAWVVNRWRTVAEFGFGPDANFREAVMEHVWGEWTHFSPDRRHDRGNGDFVPSGWVLMDNDSRYGIGYAETKNDALYNALLAEGARRRG